MNIAVTIVIYTVLVFATSAIGALTGIGGGVVRKPVFDALGDFNAAEIAFLNVLTVTAMSLVSILKQSKNFRFSGLKSKAEPLPNLPAQTLENEAAAEAAVTDTEAETSHSPSSPVPETENRMTETANAIYASGAENDNTENPKDSRPVFRIKNLFLLSVGSVAGGIGGELLFAALVKDAPDAKVKLVQNSILLVTVVLVLLYMILKEKIPTAHLKNSVWYVAAGLLLGVISSFLGIGGGPMNLAVLMLMFSMETKEAAYSSLLIILVSQTAKLLISAVSGTILVVTAPLVYTSAAFLIAGAVAGGFVGSFLSKKFSDKAVTAAFNILQIILIGVIVYNIVQTSAMN